MRTKTFQGLVPHPDHVSEVATVPYDVVNTAEARELARDRPYDLLHVDRAEIDLPDDTDPYSDIVYQTAKKRFLDLQEEGILQREAAPCLYVYRQTMGSHRQTGVALACHVDDYGENIIRKHEKTRKVKEDDRTRLVDTLSAHTGPIFLTYRDVREIDDFVRRIESTDPDYTVTDERGVLHEVWRVTGSDAEALVARFNDVPCSYVADGHHRSASAWRVGTRRRAANPNHTGQEDYNWFLGVLFPARQLKILGYHRVIKTLKGLTPAQFVERIGRVARVESNGRKEPIGPGETCLYLEGVWHTITWPPAEDASAVERLDVASLQKHVLEPILGIHDVRTDENIDFIGGIRGTAALEECVDSGNWAAAFSMYPVTVEQLMEIADAGEIMPPKSTWFEPKIRSGLFIYTMDDRGF